jgi:hypothetical protein
VQERVAGHACMLVFGKWRSLGGAALVSWSQDGDVLRGSCWFGIACTRGVVGGYIGKVRRDDGSEDSCDHCLLLRRWSIQ